MKNGESGKSKIDAASHNTLTWFQVNNTLDGGQQLLRTPASRHLRCFFELLPQGIFVVLSTIVIPLPETR